MTERGGTGCRQMYTDSIGASSNQWGDGPGVCFNSPVLMRLTVAGIHERQNLSVRGCLKFRTSRKIVPDRPELVFTIRGIVVQDCPVYAELLRERLTT